MESPVPPAGPHLGRVTAFDPTRGWGTVKAEGMAGEDFDFHATAIADGSRHIAEGAVVCFTVAPGHRGRFEARHLRPAR